MSFEERLKTEITNGETQEMGGELPKKDQENLSARVSSALSAGEQKAVKKMSPDERREKKASYDSLYKKGVNMRQEAYQSTAYEEDGGYLNTRQKLAFVRYLTPEQRDLYIPNDGTIKSNQFYYNIGMAIANSYFEKANILKKELDLELTNLTRAYNKAQKVFDNLSEAYKVFEKNYPQILEDISGEPELEDLAAKMKELMSKEDYNLGEVGHVLINMAIDLTARLRQEIEEIRIE